MEETNKNQLDNVDIAVAIGCGTLTAAMDILWMNNISLIDADNDGRSFVENFIKKMAQGSDGKEVELSKAVEILETNKMLGDKVTNKYGGGSKHHLWDFSHHASPFGLAASILMQYTGYDIGTDKQGKINFKKIDGWKKAEPWQCIANGTVIWVKHLISDMAGASGTIRKGGNGTGIPGPIMSLLKEISALPVVNHIQNKGESIPEICQELFEGKTVIINNQSIQFDFRTEIGLAYNSIKEKQYIPVILNIVLVSAFYSIRRLLQQIKEKQIDSFERWNEIDIKLCLPIKNETVRHMRTISAVSFSVIDIGQAGFCAYFLHKKDRGAFAVEFLQRINYCGLGSLILSTDSEIIHGIKKIYDTFAEKAEEQKKALIENIPNGHALANQGERAVKLGMAIKNAGTPFAMVSIALMLYKEIEDAKQNQRIAHENRIRIEQECIEHIAIIQENRALMEETVSDYLYNKALVFTTALDTMDRAITENDIEGYILGSNSIQEELTGKSMFKNMQEFDSMMMDEDTIVF